MYRLPALSFITLILMTLGVALTNSSMGTLSEYSPASLSRVSRPYEEAYVFVDFRDININSENKYLDGFAIELQENPKLTGFILTYGGRTDPPNAAMASTRRIRDYLVQDRKIDGQRIRFRVAKYRLREEHTYLYIVPPGAKDPQEVSPRKRKQVR